MLEMGGMPGINEELLLMDNQVGSGAISMVKVMEPIEFIMTFLERRVCNAGSDQESYQVFTSTEACSAISKMGREYDVWRAAKEKKRRRKKNNMTIIIIDSIK